MSLFGKIKRIINESNHTKILLEKDSEALKQYKASKKSFEKGFGKNIKPTVVQPGLDLYKAGGPFIPDKTTYKDTGKKVPKMEPKPQFGKPKTITKPKTGAPDRSLLKSTIKNVKDSERRLFQKGLGKGTTGVKGVEGKKGISLVRQRKYTKEIIKDLSAKTTQSDARVRGSSTEGSAGASSSSKTVTPTKPQKSTSAIEYTKKINQANKNRKEFTGGKKSFSNFAKQAETAKNKLRKDVDKIAKNPNLTGSQKAKQSRPVMRNVKIAQDFERGYKSNPTNAVVRTKDLEMIKKTTPDKDPKNKTIKPRKDKGTFKTSTGNNKVTTSKGRGVGSNPRVTVNKDFAKDFKTSKSKTPNKFDNIIKNYQKNLKKNPEIGGVRNVGTKAKKLVTPAAKAFLKAGPLGKLAAGALVAGGAIYGANQIRKAFAGGGKPKAPPVVKGSALRYTSGPKKGEKKYSDISKMKTKYFTKSDLKDAGFNDKADKKLQQKLRSTK